MTLTTFTMEQRPVSRELLESTEFTDSMRVLILGEM